MEFDVCRADESLNKRVLSEQDSAGNNLRTEGEFTEGQWEMARRGAARPAMHFQNSQRQYAAD
jgi:hypothetical protein